MDKEFSVLVYKDKGPHQRAGGTYDHMLVETSDEMDEALAAGWSRTLPDAIAVGLGAPVPIVAVQPTSDMPPTRSELAIKAEELGLSFTAKTTDKKLGEMIASALAKE